MPAKEFPLYFVNKSMIEKGFKFEGGEQGMRGGQVLEGKIRFLKLSCELESYQRIFFFPVSKYFYYGKIVI